MRLADWVVVGLAIALPWSTSATVILIVIWAMIVIPAIEPAEFKREMTRPAAFLPVAIVALAAIGMLWANVPFNERLKGIDSFLKLLTIPLFMIQFRRSDRGFWVLGAFLVSGLLLLIVSGVSLVSPIEFAKAPGVPVKEYISQSTVFTICAFGLLYLAIDAIRLGLRLYAAVLFAACLLFLANMIFVVSSRTALVTIPFLLLLLGLKQFGWKKGAIIAAVVAVGASAVWMSSSNVRNRLGSLSAEIETYWAQSAHTSAGQRLDFWIRSAAAVSKAPIFGHGTGTIKQIFRQSASGEGPSSILAANPHNQTLGVAMQLGLAGVFLLFAMWFFHAALFRHAGIVPWTGLLIVTQNVIGSVANSHLFDFTHGWIYVIGVGVVGGMASKQHMPTSIFSPSREAATANP